MTQYDVTLLAILPDARWSITGDGTDYSLLTWKDESPKPTQQELDDAWPSVRDSLAWGRVRAERDRLLSDCDWTQVADAPLTASEKVAWADYRQALRDVPQTQADPESVVWTER